MRKILTLTLAAASLAAGLAPTIASAQDRHRDRQEARDERRDDRRDLRQDRRDIRQDRREVREDWRAYRESHGDAFRGPAYAGPRGFAYRPVNPGYRFAPEYYHRRYWISNPGAYRLPVAPPHQRWVRYGRDVVRVDIGTGRVVQVYGSFFL